MPTLRKSIKILIVLGLVHLAFSAFFFMGGCRCDNPVVPFNLDSLSIQNINNSGAYPTITSNNSMHSAAVAFSVSLADTNLYYPYYLTRGGTSVMSGFAAAHATSMDCEPILVPNQKIVGINIVTLHGINPAVQPGADVTSLFLARSTMRYTGSSQSNFENLFTQLNFTQNDRPELNFSVYLKVPVVNTVARFFIVVSLSNGTILSDTTNLISIIPN